MGEPVEQVVSLDSLANPDALAYFATLAQARAGARLRGPRR